MKTAYRGPACQMVEARTWESHSQQAAGVHDHPVVERGAVRAWPAWKKWSFEQLAELRYPDGTEAVCRFQEGLVEQGSAQPLSTLPVAPYMRVRAAAAETPVA